MADHDLGAHVLAPDLKAIDAFAAHPDQPGDAAGRAARALYDDVVRRLARAELPGPARARVAALEARAAELVAGFVRRGLPPRYFWADFAAIAHELDDVASTAGARMAEAVAARALLADLRRGLAARPLPPSPRGRVHEALGRLATAVDAFEDERAGAAALQAHVDAARQAVDGAVAALDGLAADGPEARFHRLATAALATEPTPAGRAAIAARLAALHDAWAAGGPLPAAGLDALEQAIAAASAVPAPVAAGPAVPGLPAAARQVEQAVSRLATAPLPPFVADAAAVLVRELRALVRARAGGELDAATFEARFATELDAVEACLAFAREVGAERDVAACRVAALVRRAEREGLPPLLAGALEDELERLRALMADLEAGRTSIMDFHPAFERTRGQAARLFAWHDAT